MRLTRHRRWLRDRAQLMRERILVVSGTAEEVSFGDLPISEALYRRFHTDRVAAYYRAQDRVVLWVGPAGSPSCEAEVALESVPENVRQKLFPHPSAPLSAPEGVLESHSDLSADGSDGTG